MPINDHVIYLFVFVCLFVITLQYRQTGMKTKYISDETVGTDGQLRITLAAKEVIYIVHRKETSIMVKLGEQSRVGNEMTF